MCLKLHIALQNEQSYLLWQDIRDAANHRQLMITFFEVKSLSAFVHGITAAGSIMKNDRSTQPEQP